MKKIDFDLEALKIKLYKIAALLLAVLLLGSLIRSIKKTREVQRKIASKEEHLRQLEREGEELKRKLEEAKKPEFIEQQLRDKLGYAKPGEIVVILPEEEVLRGLAPNFEEEEDVLPDPNWKKWLNIFLK